MAEVNKLASATIFFHEQANGSVTMDFVLYPDEQVADDSPYFVHRLVARVLRAVIADEGGVDNK